jgi:hypothetical protein
VKECFGIELYSGELVSSDLTYYFDGHSFARIGKVKEKKEKGREGVKKGVKEGVIKEGVSPIN